MKRAALLLTVLMVLAASTSWAWISFTPEVTESDLVKVFEEIETNGPSWKATEELEEFISANPYESPSDEALLMLARTYSELEDPDAAESAYEKLLDRFPGSPFKYQALYELGYLKYKKGELAPAEGLVEQVSASKEATIGLRVRARALLKDIDSALYVDDYKFDVPVIGALFPMSGPYAEFGEAALKGVLLAAEVFGKEYGPVEVYVRDVSTDRREARRVVKDLASEKRVVGLVGPLLSAAARDAAVYAQRRGVPMVTLSVREGLASTGDYVFRNSLTLEQQAVTLADYASYELELTRYAILYPSNSYGSGLATLFQRQVERLGGEVVKKVSYEPGTRDFSKKFIDLFEIEVEERLKGRRSIREFKPTVEVDAVFIPDYYQTISLVAPFFKYYNIEDVKLLGSNGWNSPDLVEMAGSYVEGAVFVDGFFSESSRSGTAEFVTRYKDTYGTEPGVLAAQAYDAARVIITSLGRDGRTGQFEMDRKSLRLSLEEITGYQGAAGGLSFGPEGEAEKELFVLTVERGRIKEAPFTKPRPAETPEREGAEGAGDGEAGAAQGAE